MKRNYILGLILFWSLLSCEDKKAEKEQNEVTKTISTDLQVDHLNIWVKNPTLLKERLNDLGFTSIPDSLSKVHKGQGTSGRYFYFLNGYLELIFVYNQAELYQSTIENMIIVR